MACSLAEALHELTVEHAVPAEPQCPLTPSEVEVVSLASRGLTTKVIAYELGVAPSTVSTRLARAARKVGVPTRHELVRLASVLTCRGLPATQGSALTPAERDILELIQRGLSNDEIATMRSRSVHTVANQVASLLRKTQTPSRRGLLCLVRESR